MRALVVSALAASLLGGAAHAQTYYYGLDAGAAPGAARPNADAAQAAFLAAAATVGALQPVIDFESIATGFDDPLVVNAAVTADFDGADPGASGIYDVDSVILGFNTTLGGERFLRFAPNFAGANSDSTATITFNFAAPINAFGAFFTGVQPNFGAFRATFDDGAVQTYDIAGDPDGGVLFFGFTDAGRFISSVSFSTTALAGSGVRDLIGVDDIYFANAAAIPEPTSWALMILGFGAAGALLRRRQAPLPA